MRAMMFAAILMAGTAFGAAPETVAQEPAATQAALAAAWEQLGLPSGADFFLEFRRFVAGHDDTYARGPTTAAQFLASRKEP